MKKGICADCSYWNPDIQTGIKGQCYRYPERRKKLEPDWCGEWQPREEDRQAEARRQAEDNERWETKLNAEFPIVAHESCGTTTEFVVMGVLDFLKEVVGVDIKDD